MGAGQDDTDKSRTATLQSAPATKAKPAATKRDDRDVGAALRSVYQKTVEETVPDEFLDLLGKLG